VSLRHNGKDYDYDMAVVIDLSKYKPLPDPTDADEQFEFPATMEFVTEPYCFRDPRPPMVEGTAQQVFDSFDEALLEWKTLLMYNDCKDRKFKVTIHVEEVA
jgi:hypothetical protein